MIMTNHRSTFCLFAWLSIASSAVVTKEKQPSPNPGRAVISGEQRAPVSNDEDVLCPDDTRKRVVFIGDGASGKSTIIEKLTGKTGLPGAGHETAPTRGLQEIALKTSEVGLRKRLECCMWRYC